MQRILATVSVMLVVLAGCADRSTVEQAARDRETSRAEWKLVLEEAGVTETIPVERLDIYLSEDETETEIFELRGDGLVLVGEIPAELRVGYEEAFDRLVGRSIPIHASGGDPREPKRSMVTVDGIRAVVTGGVFQIERTSGTWDGSDGNRTLYGTVELRVPDGTGERVLRGRLAAHAVTWG